MANSFGCLLLVNKQARTILHKDCIKKGVRDQGSIVMLKVMQDAAARPSKQYRALNN